MKLDLSKGWLGVLVTASCLAACASSVPPPHDQYAAAQADIGRAQAGGAPSVPEARLHLQLATEDLQQSKQLMGNDDTQATLLAAVARSEAQLALALATQNDARQRADKADAELRHVEGR